MEEQHADTLVVLAEARQAVEENDYKHQLLQELLGQFRQATAPDAPLCVVDAMASPLASARALMAERRPAGLSGQHAGESIHQRRPLRVRGLVI
ncbi:hypothetical protein P5705_14040 [Pseudomonas entomophila]|uniref:hypothetical protein n=1 Tax=Pseudomonas entomophila TaxID=312306 RepID=UPI0024051613|nr:hypothetical protein [Pseudomonas entomophila]MDF9618768.1 hypothetical protein [Pseudomonas entomophila]